MDDVINHFDETKAGIVLGIEDFREKDKENIGKNFGISTQAVANILTELENRYPEPGTLKKELGSIKCIMWA